MLHELNDRDADCSIAQALAVVGDWWSLLIVRDIAGGTVRFDGLQSELEISRKVLTQRLRQLVADGVVDRVAYTERPPRFEYRLTAKGHALLPVLVALQDWGARYVMGTGDLTGTTNARSLEARRVRNLVGSTIPHLRLPGVDRTPVDIVDPVARWTVLYCFPGAYADPHDYPPGWSTIPGAAGCVLQTTSFRDQVSDYRDLDAVIIGVSTQRPDQLGSLADHHGVPFRLLSDEGLQLAASLRLPTFRAGGDRLKRLTMIVDDTRTIRQVIYPITDSAASVDQALADLRRLSAPPGQQSRTTDVQP